MKKSRYLYVVYDIGDDDTRSILSDILTFYGLHRVQYSVFSGVLSAADKFEMIREIESLYLGENAKIYILDLCAKCSNNIITIGKSDEDREYLIL